MAKRKVTYRQLNIRMTDDLHKRITAEAKKNGWPVNRELVRRLERSFVDQGVEALINAAAERSAQQFSNVVVDHFTVVMRDVVEELNRINQSVGAPGPVNKGEHSNG
jgi:hypothetical protein